MRRILRPKRWNLLSLENVTVLVCSCRGLTVQPVLSGELSGAGTSVTSAFSSWKPGEPYCHAESVGKRGRQSEKKKDPTEAEIADQKHFPPIKRLLSPCPLGLLIRGDMKPKYTHSFQRSAPVTCTILERVFVYGKEAAAPLTAEDVTE